MSQMCEQLSRLNRSAARRESVTAPVDDAVLRHLKDVLGAYLGPVSTVIVDEHARRAMSQRSLIDALAAEIDGDEAREDFFRAAARAGARDAQD